MELRIKNTTKQDMVFKMRPPRKGDVGLDILLCIDDGTDYVELEVAEMMTLKTGIAVDIPEGYWGLISLEKSSMAQKGVINLAGVMDSSYTGEYKLVCMNLGPSLIRLYHGQKIAQLIIFRQVPVDGIVPVSELKETVRGEGAFGSTGEFNE